MLKGGLGGEGVWDQIMHLHSQLGPCSGFCEGETRGRVEESVAMVKHLESSHWQQEQMLKKLLARKPAQQLL